MRTRLITTVLVAALSFTATAEAKSIKVKGPIEGDGNGTVSMTVKTKNGNPVKATKIKVSRADYLCNDGRFGEVSLSLGSSRFFESGPGFFNFGSVASQYPQKKYKDGLMLLAGATTNGKTVEGDVVLRFDIASDGDPACGLGGPDVGSVPYKAKK
jgi:hypothetical protein